MKWPFRRRAVVEVPDTYVVEVPDTSGESAGISRESGTSRESVGTSQGSFRESAESVREKVKSTVISQEKAVDFYKKDRESYFSVGSYALSPPSSQRLLTSRHFPTEQADFEGSARTGTDLADACASAAEDLAQRLGLDTPARRAVVRLAASLPERGLPSAFAALDDLPVDVVVDEASREAMRSILRAVPRAKVLPSTRGGD